MCVPIQRVLRDASGNITHIGGAAPDGTPWGVRSDRAIFLIEDQLYRFYVEVPAGYVAPVLVKMSSAGRKFLTTSPDGVTANNLDALPSLPNPLEQLQPPYPFSIPASLEPMEVTSFSVSDNNRGLWSAGSGPYRMRVRHLINPPSALWNSPTPHWIYLNAIVPFPADFGILINYRALNLVPGDAPGRRYALEQNGQGWWSYDYIVVRPDGTVDPTKPSRFTEIRIVVRPPLAAWTARNFELMLSGRTLNPFCVFRDEPTGQLVHTAALGDIIFEVRQSAIVPIPGPQPSVTVPSVIGERLDVALKTLWDLDLIVSNSGPTAMSKDLVVTAQDPPGGTQVSRRSSVLLSTRLAVPPVGVRRVIINNQSDRGTTNVLWVYDYTAGGWEQKGQVAYQQTIVVDGFTDGHNYQLVAVDAQLPRCRTQRPEEGSNCIYQSMSGTFVADDDGSDVNWQIL